MQMRKYSKKTRKEYFDLLSLKNILISFMAAAAIYLLGFVCIYPTGDMRYSCIAVITGTEMNRYFLGANILKWILIALIGYIILGILYQFIRVILRKR